MAKDLTGDAAELADRIVDAIIRAVSDELDAYRRAHPAMTWVTVDESVLLMLQQGAALRDKLAELVAGGKAEIPPTKRPETGV